MQLEPPSRPPAAWPERLVEFGRRPGGPPGTGSDPAALSEFWILVNAALRQQIRAQSRRLGAIGAEDVKDLAAEKALELLQKLDRGRWNLGRSTPAEVAGFFSTIARNAVVDHLRRTGRRTMVPVEELDHADPRGALVPLAGGLLAGGLPNGTVERRAFAGTLADCARALDPKHRIIWFFRVFYDLPTKRIAAHPEVGLKPGHVDVILQRCRDRMRACMRAKGYDTREMPPGTFAELWSVFRLDLIPSPGGRVNV